MSWQWMENEKDVTDFTERGNFRKVLLKGRLAVVIKKLDLCDRQPWLGEARIARAMGDLLTGRVHVPELDTVRNNL